MKILVDTREKKGWDFANAELHKLDTGDYSVEGIEDKLCIERKASVSELAGNITEPRFLKELERMKEYPHAYLILEFSEADVALFPKNAKIPGYLKRQIRAKGPFLIGRIDSIPDTYNVEVIFANDKETARLTALSIMEEMYERYRTG